MISFSQRDRWSASVKRVDGQLQSNGYMASFSQTGRCSASVKRVDVQPQSKG
ncbi:hypothetical protein DPMN_017080 [Dreissena polymorpha]|uniref:Uncharacterized protein n=1 Tax=Dreissena polymorpha TaxID=45954 RepID=A0A9D4NFS5_DREPO|nr:hypothetical protein DPMN_017080 [Dreissena polymorpha]